MRKMLLLGLLLFSAAAQAQTEQIVVRQVDNFEKYGIMGSLVLALGSFSWYLFKQGEKNHLLNQQRIEESEQRTEEYISKMETYLAQDRKELLNTIQNCNDAIAECRKALEGNSEVIRELTEVMRHGQSIHER